MSKKLTEKEAYQKVIDKCKEISTSDEIIEFKGWVGKYENSKTKLILYNSKLKITWDTSRFSDLINHNIRSPRLTENMALENVKEKCLELSTPEETITFLGWKNNKWIGNKTCLILYNSKIDYTWDSTIYNSFISLSIKKPRFFDESYYKDQIISKCLEISDEEEIITFLGWKNDKWVGSTTKVILYNSRLDITWDTATYTDVMVNGNRYPNWSLIPEDKRELVKRSIPPGWLDSEKLKKKLLSIYPDKNWDYSKLEYKNLDTPVCIICKEHGEFWITPRSLIENLVECPVCRELRRTKEFIESVKKLNPDKNWDYSKVTYKNNITKVCIVCHEIDQKTGKEHGEFWITPKNLLSGSLCPKCSNVYRPTSEEFIEVVKEIHPEFSYEKTKYENAKTKICVTCPEHGDFWTLPGRFINSSIGCPECRYRYLAGLHTKSQEVFEKEVVDKFGEGKYDLSQSKYIKATEPVIIRCIEHDVWFSQRPHDLLDGARGCPECQKISTGEELILGYLRENQIDFVTQLRIDSSDIPDCPNKDFIKVDFSLEYQGRKIWIEFNGQQHYRPIRFFQKTYSDFEKQQSRDQSVREYARSCGIELLEIPYTDLQRIPEILDSFLKDGVDITTKI